MPEWVEIIEVKDINLQSTIEIDAGEVSAIILGLEHPHSLLIIDDNKGRKVAKRLGLNITGSLGIFLKAKGAGIIPSVRSIIQKV